MLVNLVGTPNNDMTSDDMALVREYVRTATSLLDSPASAQTAAMRLRVGVVLAVVVVALLGIVVW